MLAAPPPLGLSDLADVRRLTLARTADRAARSELGQFLTPAPVAELMASLFARMPPAVRLLDAGAAVGSLTAAFVAEATRRDARPRSIEATVCELDPAMLPALASTLRDCAAECDRARIAVKHGAPSRVVVSSSDGPDDDWIATREVGADEIDERRGS